MREKKESIVQYMGLVLIIAAVSSIGCDDLISGVKGFEENRPPEITSFTSDIAAGTEIWPTKDVNFTVQASDYEGDEIRYIFSSDFGTFRKQETTATGSTIQFFISSTCPTSESIPVTVTAVDGKGDSSESTLDLGDGKTEPTITAVWDDTNLGSGSIDVDFSADYSGYYQIITQNPPGVTPEFDYDLGGDSYIRYAEVSETISLASGTTRVYIIIYDNFLRQGTVYADFTY